MIQVKAPGKLYIAGEYAVTEPGYKSVLIAVDRFVTAAIEASNEVEGSIYSKHCIMSLLNLIVMKIDRDFRCSSCKTIKICRYCD